MDAEVPINARVRGVANLAFGFAPFRPRLCAAIGGDEDGEG